MAAGNSDRPKTDEPGAEEVTTPMARSVRKARKASTGDALRKVFANGDGPAPDPAAESRPRAVTTSRARRATSAGGRREETQASTVAETPTTEAHTTEAHTTEAMGDNAQRSDWLVSEAVMAGLDAVSTSRVRVPVGAGAGGGGGGGGLPARPEEDEARQVEVPTHGTPTVAPPSEGEDTELEESIAHKEPKPHPLVRIGGVLDSFLREAGEMTGIGGQVIKSAITKPKGYWGDVRDQIYDGMKLCWLPMVIAVGGFGFGAPGLQGGNILYLFGVPDRDGGFMMFASIREFAPFVEGMVVAGVVGTAITADLGARRIREEIDAMEVLGVDPVRKLILPRVISTTILTAFLDLFALFVGIIGGFFAGLLLGSSPAGFVASFFTEANISDDWGSFVKCGVFGLIIGLVCCYKGYRAKGGPAGVGRAVNQAVVISFALIWVTDYTFTNLLLGYAPSTQLIK